MTRTLAIRLRSKTFCDRLRTMIFAIDVANQLGDSMGVIGPATNCLSSFRCISFALGAFKQVPCQLNLGPI